MARPPFPPWLKVAGFGLPVTGGVSWLITLDGIPKTTAIVIAAALLAVTPIATAVAFTLPRVVESIQRRKARNLKARCDVITAQSQADALRSLTKTYAKIVKIGVEAPEKAESAVKMLRMLVLFPGLKEKQRLPNDVLDRHLANIHDKGSAQKPSVTPKGRNGGGARRGAALPTKRGFAPPPTKRAPRAPSPADSPNLRIQPLPSSGDPPDQP